MTTYIMMINVVPLSHYCQTKYKNSPINIMHTGIKNIENVVDAAMMMTVAIPNAMKGSIALNTICANDLFSLIVIIASSCK